MISDINCCFHGRKLEESNPVCLVDLLLCSTDDQHKEKPTRRSDDKSGIQHSPPPYSMTATALDFGKSIGLKNVSALIGKTITLPLPVFDFLVFLFRKHRQSHQHDSMNGIHCQQHLRLDPSQSGRP